MKLPEIIFIDLDGTSLDKKENKKYFFSQKNVEMIKKINQIIPIIVSTGRGNNKQTWEILNQINANSFIAWNGAQIIKNKQIIYSFPIKNNTIEHFYQQVKFTKGIWILNSDFKKEIYSNNLFLRFFLKIIGKKVKCFSKLNLEKDIYKIIFWTLSKKRVLNYQKQWNNLFKNTINISLSGKKNNFLEITSLEASKGQAEKLFCLSEGINVKNAIHVGDSMNDASTKNIVGKLVAMQNASELLKDLADEVILYSYKNAGLAKYLKKFEKIAK
ncbi:HAD hydrolase family protein [Mycoplasmopsis cricetuli]|uniref:HAD hydrolase family protein n=1 Tax=Mycoplasmopsis cricetuli TaxID=171283 RepID=UPI00047100B9|nr:HAD family hydrolase [Mycoplasmopsis cricetuli]